MTRDPLISAEELKPLLASGGVQVVDATWFMPDSGRDARAEYLAGHLPGAVFFDIDAIADKSSPLPHMLPTPSEFAKAVGALGIGDGDTLVIYDRPPIPSAPRVWWSFRAMGHTDVRVLDGGLEAWRSAGGPLERGDPQSTEAVYVAKANPGLVRDFDATLQALRDGAAQMVDARPAARFRGEAAEPRAGLRAGHAPGSRSLPSSTFYGPDGRFLASPAVEKAFASADIDTADPVIASCGSGVTAGVIALALARLGHEETAVYDGSWAEWGARTDAPVVTGP